MLAALFGSAMPDVSQASVGGAAGLLAGASVFLALAGYCLRELNKFRDSQYAAEGKRRKEAEAERDAEKAKRKELQAQYDATLTEMQKDIADLHQQMTMLREEHASQREEDLKDRRAQDIMHADQIRAIEREQRALRTAQEERHQNDRREWQAKEVRLVGETHRLRVALAATTEGLPPELDPARPDVPMLMPDMNNPTESPTVIQE